MLSAVQVGLCSVETRAGNEALRRFHSHGEVFDEKLELFQLGEEESPSRDLLCDCDIFVELRVQL